MRDWASAESIKTLPYLVTSAAAPTAQLAHASVAAVEHEATKQRTASFNSLLQGCCSTRRSCATTVDHASKCDGAPVQAFYRRGEGRLVGMQMTPQKLKLLRKAIATLAEHRYGASSALAS